LPLAEQNVTLALSIQNLATTGVFGNLLRVLAAQSIEEPESPYGALWKRIVAGRAFAYFRQLKTTGQTWGVFTLLTQVFNGIILKTLSSEGFRNLLSEFVQLVLDYKEEIVRDDPTRYTRLVGELKVVFPGSIALTLESPIPTNVDRYVAKHTLQEYVRALSSFQLAPKLSFGVVPLLQNYAS
jgi:hypothetical protein